MNSNKIEIPFFIRYDEWIASHSLTWIGESIIGLEILLPKLIDVSGIDEEEISVKVTEVQWGCIIFSLSIDILIAIDIFKNVKDFYDVLQFLAPDISSMWAEIIKLHRDINDFAATNPVDYDLIKWTLGNWTLIMILSQFIKRLVKILPSQKNFPNTEFWDYVIPTKIAQKAHRLVNANIFNKTLHPFVDWKIKSIEFWTEISFNDREKIDARNFWDFLGEDQKILPDWIDWEIKSVQWKFVSWQIKKWKSLTFRVNGIKKSLRDLVCYPDESMEITDFTNFLAEESLSLKVEISRVSLYEKPKLIIHEISKTILSLDI